MNFDKSNSHVGEKVAHLLVQEKMEKNRLAEHLGLKRHQVYSLLKSESIDFKILLKICVIFKKPIAYFVNFKEFESIDFDILGTNKEEKDRVENYFLKQINDLQASLISKQEELNEAKNELLKLERKLNKK